MSLALFFAVLSNQYSRLPPVLDLRSRIVFRSEFLGLVARPRGSPRPASLLALANMLERLLALPLWRESSPMTPLSLGICVKARSTIVWHCVRLLHPSYRCGIDDHSLHLDIRYFMHFASCAVLTPCGSLLRSMSLLLPSRKLYFYIGMYG